MNLSVLRIFNMKRPKLCKPYDPVDYLESKEDFALYLQSCFEDDPGDGSLIKSALLDIAKAKGMAEVARKSGLTDLCFSCSASNRAVSPRAQSRL